MRKTKRNKIKITAAITIALVLIFSAAITISPPAFAQTVLPGYTPMPDRDTWTEVGVSPDLVGVNQEVTINIMTYPGPSGPTYEAQYLVGSSHAGFGDISITITDPDGIEDTFMPIDETLAQVGIEIPGQAQIVGHLQFRYTPTKVGEYTMTASFPGEFYTTDNIYEPGKLSVYYKPSSSTKPATLTVQQDKVIESGLLTGWPWSSLPEDYWENPVQTDNREWYQISGDWLQKGWDSAASKYNLFSTAPASPHILWTRELWTGGLPGGIWGSLPNPSGFKVTYGFFDSPVIMDGKIYLNTRTAGNFECIDLRTGEKLWEKPGSINGGQRLDTAFQTHSQLGEGQIDSFLWGGMTPASFGPGSDKWYIYNPTDGELIRTITNVPPDLSGIKVQDGSPIIWCVQSDLSKWNTTDPMKLPYVNLIKWDFDKMTTTIGWYNIPSTDWRDGIVWNVSCQTGNGPGGVDVGDNNFRGANVYPFYGANVVVVKTPNAMQCAVGFDMTTGALKWENYAMVHDLDVLYEGVATSPDGPLIKQNSGAPEWVAYDVKTGNEIWRAPTGELPWSMLPSYAHIYHDGVHFLGSYDGHVYAYDSDNGQQIWQSDYLGEQWETIYGNQPITSYTNVGAEGKLYFSTETIYDMMPRPRFHESVCIDEATGKIIWRLPIGITFSGVADGYLLGADIDNGIMYCLGKGKTETTVTASPSIIAKGTSVLIEGSVMDMSPGAPNTPAVVGEDMSEWMDYLHGQNATLKNNPPIPKGVPVKLAYQMTDESWKDIGETISDEYGNFGFAWTPPDEGTYKVKAFFLGSESYWGSAETTYLSVGPAPSPGQPETEEPSAEAPFPTTEVAIVAAVAVVAVVVIGAYWALSRRR